MNIGENENDGIFHFLDDLRDNGGINMFGAAPIIQEVFQLTKAEAREILTEYLERPKKDFT